MIIAIEAASTDLSIALAHPDGRPIRDDAWISAQRQSAELLPRLLTLASSANRTLSDATAIAVGVGPGSFTGLRVAMALAKGLAFSLERPIVGVPSLAAWLLAVPEAELAFVRAGAREAYVLERGGEAPEILGTDALGTRIGARVAVGPADLAGALAPGTVVSPAGAASGIATMAAERLGSRPEGDDLRRLEPTYLRAPRGVVAPKEELKWL